MLHSFLIQLTHGICLLGQHFPFQLKRIHTALGMRRIATHCTQHQSVELWQSALATEFRVAGAVHAFHHRRRYLTGLAWDLIAASALLRPSGPPRSVLMLGLAGGTAFRILRQLLPECALTAVDIDSGIVRLARRHMELDVLEIEVIVDDAYRWLAANRRRFDVVIDDIYLAGRTDVFRPKAWDPRLLARLRRAVAPGGLLTVNLVTGPGHRAIQSLTRAVLRRSFPVVRSLRTPGAMNEVLVAGRDVATRSMLAGYTKQFTDRADRRHWQAIQVHRLGGAAADC
jgi:predicted O-methyltransferase YrrM